MASLSRFVHRFWNDQRGMETVEYAVMTALIVAALVTAITAMSGAISTRFGEVTTRVNDVN